jgi:hypothetical protein
MDPIIRKLLGLQEHEMEGGKLRPETVVYLTPEQIGDPSGAHCGACFFFHRPTSECFLTSPPKCNAERGVCDFYLHGNLWEYDRENKAKPKPQKLVTKEAAGYIEEGPTHCASCEYFNGSDACEKVGGHIEPHGCCNHWEAGDED